MTTNWESLATGFPCLLFVAIAILPGLGIPNCPLLVICGTAMTVSLGTFEAVLLAVGAVIVNILWTYWVAAHPLRGFLTEKIEPRVSKLKLMRNRLRMSQRDVLYVTLLLHVTPGVPLFIQNYFPGLHRLAFWKYLSIAVPVQSLYTALIVITSGQIFVALTSHPLIVIGAGLGLWGLATIIHRRSSTKSPAV